MAFIFAIASLKAAPQTEVSSAWSGTFRRIGNTESITEDGYYLVACKAWDGSAYFMSNQVPSKGQNKKLVGLSISDNLPTTIDAPPTGIVWKCRKQSANEIAFTSTDGRTAVYAEHGDQTDIVLSESEATYWNVSSLADGTFTLRHPKSDRNFLSIYKVSQATFGNYKNYDSNSLYIYKWARPLNEVSGEAQLPADGTRVGFYMQGFVAEAKEGGELAATDAAELLLNNGSMAPDLPSAIWTCHHHGAATFTLANEQGRYLGHDLQLSHGKALWQVADGKIGTAGGEEVPRFLVFNKEEQRFVLADGEKPTHHVPATFVAVGNEPDSLWKDGIKTLSGAWSAKRLAAISWQEVNALDLTDISLPKQVKKFVNRPGDRHIILYIEENEATGGMALGDILIAKGESGYSLLTSTSLTDKQTIAFDRDFQVGEHMLSYTRQAAAGDGWETIVLPFQADVPKKWQAKVLDLFIEDEPSFRNVECIPAHTPAIIRRTEENGTEAVTFLCKAGTIKAEAAEQSEFMGTYTPLTVGSAEDSIYLLNADGTAFVKAAAGSRLMPFRAAFKLKAAGNTKQPAGKAPLALPLNKK